MKLWFLGTGAAGCRNKSESEIQGDERRCASLLVDQNVLVDVSRQSFDFLTKLGGDPSCVTDVLLSHSHEDHFCRDALLQYANVSNGRLRLWCHRGAVVHLGLTEEDLQRIDLRLVEVCDCWQIGDMTVTALPANHMAEELTDPETPLHYILEKDGKKLFYGCDGGWYTAIEWEYLMRKRVTLDGVIMDSTVGEDTGNFRIATHNNLAMLEILILALRQNGRISSDTKLIATHIARSCHSNEKPLEEVFADLGMITARDGLEIEL
ncbi:MAG: MBL fold metallo-hydrolase [Clostridia bacterium]|nr:MBL fold metallo-hydrolase [Clostridia bacterium]